MMKTLALNGLILAVFFLSGAHSAKITFTNNCPRTIWPGTLTSDQKPQLPKTGFELASKASLTLNVQAPWKGRFWARTRCTTKSGKFTCETADCSTGQVACNGNGAIPPASLVEINIAANGGKDFYDVSLVDGFNLPVSVATRGGTGDCKATSCPANVNAVSHVGYSFTNVLFPTELRLEAFFPAYLDAQFANLRPNIVTPASQTQIKYGQSLFVRFTVTGTLAPNLVSVTMVAPPLTTHSFSMNQRLLVLSSGKVTSLGKSTYQVQVTTPGSGILAPSGFYLLFVVHQDIPSEGIWVQIK